VTTFVQKTIRNTRKTAATYCEPLERCAVALKRDESFTLPANLVSVSILPRRFNLIISPQVPLSLKFSRPQCVKIHFRIRKLIQGSSPMVTYCLIKDQKAIHIPTGAHLYDATFWRCVLFLAPGITVHIIIGPQRLTDNLVLLLDLNLTQFFAEIVNTRILHKALKLSISLHTRIKCLYSMPSFYEAQSFPKRKRLDAKKKKCARPTHSH
jgi:hypothetical protein